jgi:uncharacterized NAD(P)/FAD-binding protein YdhS
MTFPKTEQIMINVSEPFDVAVIGAGASGTLVAAQFKRIAPHGRLAIIGNTERAARGVAYETQYRAHLLNVRACNMSAFSTEMDHFVNWLKPRLPKATANSYVPRRFYGDYLAAIFHETISDLKNTKYFNNTAICISRNQDLWTIDLEDGTSIESYHVVLAFGNLLVPGDPIDFSHVALNYRQNPWARDIASGLSVNDPVLLIGTGLTMVDVALSLRESGHRGPIHAISRHGQLYQSHRAHPPRQLLNLPKEFKTPAGALRWVRNEIKSAGEAGFDWRAVIDSLRPHTGAIWQSWSLAQRSSFLRHARNLWDTHRHRIAPEVSDQIGILIEDRKLIIHRGKLVSAESNGEQAEVLWKDTKIGELNRLNVARIVNCTGPARDYAQVDLPLVKALRSSGWLIPDPLRLGIETDQDGRLIGTDGEAVEGLYTLGPVRIPALWESIAIPEIRNQALALAQLLAEETIKAGIPN